MSDLDDVREDLARLNSFHPQTLLSALMEADTKIDSLEKVIGIREQSNDLIQNRADLLHRRAEIALAILRDDEAGLSYHQLNRLADIIWPKPIKDITQEPTKVPYHVSMPFADEEPEFYISSTWGERRGCELTNVAQGLLGALMDIVKQTPIQLGAWYDSYQKWAIDAAKFRAKFPTDHHSV